VLGTSKKQLVRVYSDTPVPVQSGVDRPFKATVRVTRHESLAFSRLRKLLKPGQEACFTLEGTISCDFLLGEIDIKLPKVTFEGAVNNQDNRKASGKKLVRLFTGVKAEGYDLDVIRIDPNRRYMNKEG